LVKTKQTGASKVVEAPSRDNIKRWRHIGIWLEISLASDKILRSNYADPFADVRDKVSRFIFSSQKRESSRSIILHDWKDKRESHENTGSRSMAIADREIRLARCSRESLSKASDREFPKSRAIFDINERLAVGQSRHNDVIID
jgi:hypothetical protein